MKVIHRNQKKQALFLFVLMILVFNLNFKIQKKPEQTVNERHEVTVRLVLVDVIATDKDGKCITDLTIDDFKIYEEGKEVPINSLDLLSYELSGTKIEKAAEAEEQKTPSSQIKRKNKFFVIFDSINTVRRMLNRSKAKILEKLINLVRAGGEIMVLELTEKGEAQILQPLTTDEELIAQAIHKASGSIWVEKATDDLMAPKIIEDRPDILESIFKSSKALYEYKNRIRFEKTLNAFLSVMNMIKDYPDRKPVLLVSSGFPSLSFERYASPSIKIESTVGHADLQAAKINDPFLVLGQGKNRFEDDIFENLIQFANTHNITFYTMDPDTYLRYVMSDMA
ncbi:MAG: VWA domain-containing protein, partial [Candidatus Aminicenantes bacterium]|nr:VWA domain-containing protein [Candidatus Aminicenantes bacterium]